MKKYIIFICSDTRVKPFVDIKQVAKTTHKKYKVGDYLTINDEEYYETKKGKLVKTIKESLLLKVSRVFANVVYCNIVGE